MAPPTPAPTLTCGECGYLNEPERVYCHNCGAKLDRTALPKEEQMRREPADKARRRIMRMTNPGVNPVRDALSSVFKTLFSALCAAWLILLVLPPRELPPPKEGINMRTLSSDLMDLVNAPQPRSTSFTQTEINNYLATARVKKEGLVPGVNYVRTFVNLSPGVARITLERSFWGYSIYYGTLYRVEANAGVLSVANVGGNVGRLALSPFLMQYLEKFLMKDIQETFKTELAQLKQMAFLRVEKERLALASGGKKS